MPVLQRRPYNPKRRMVEPRPDQTFLDGLSSRVRYVGSPLHKRNPGNFGLTPPSHPRPDKTLCDQAGIVSLEVAQSLLREGIRRGMISQPPADGFPKNVWAVHNEVIVLEAQYNNTGPGDYHGYPLLEPDPFREIVLTRWFGR